MRIAFADRSHVGARDRRSCADGHRPAPRPPRIQVRPPRELRPPKFGIASLPSLKARSSQRPPIRIAVQPSVKAPSAAARPRPPQVNPALLSAPYAKDQGVVLTPCRPTDSKATHSYLYVYNVLWGTEGTGGILMNDPQAALEVEIQGSWVRLSFPDSLLPERRSVAAHVHAHARHDREGAELPRSMWRVRLLTPTRWSGTPKPTTSASPFPTRPRTAPCRSASR